MKLRTDQIKKSYKGRQVVKGVTVEVSQGEIVGLLGPNGAGKTTSFYMIVGLVSPDEGNVYLDDKVITNTAMYRRSKLGIGYLPQEVSVFRKLSVEDNIMAVLEMTKLSRQERKDKLEELLDEFSLHHVRKNLGKQLSGGEKRRTEIARALATDPKFILLDEPFAGVDPIAVEDIQSIVYKLKDRNIGILITDHNVQETLSITDRAYLLFEGNILRSGTAESLAADEVVKKVYLGQNFELKRKDFSKKDQALQSNEHSHELKFIHSLLQEINFVSSASKKDVSKINGLIDTSKTIFNSSDTHPKIMDSLSKIEKASIGLKNHGTANQILWLVPVIGWYLLGRKYAVNKKMEKKIDLILSESNRLRNFIENPEFLKL